LEGGSTTILPQAAPASQHVQVKVVKEGNDSFKLYPFSNFYSSFFPVSDPPYAQSTLYQLDGHAGLIQHTGVVAVTHTIFLLVSQAYNESHFCVTAFEPYPNNQAANLGLSGALGNFHFLRWNYVHPVLMTYTCLLSIKARPYPGMYLLKGFVSQFEQ
jgi:hypothetical protein